MTPDLLPFDEPIDLGPEPGTLLGGKGAGLVMMAGTLGLPVPPGFVITTTVCRRYLAQGWPDGLGEQIEAQMARLGERVGRRFGGTEAPLLVSVRSGAPVSMPGMMDTLLNVGMTPAVRERLAAESGSPVFAAATWLRFCRMYAEIVLGIPRAAVGEHAEHDGSTDGMLLAAGRIRRLAAAHDGSGIPGDPTAQLRGAIEAVFRSWNSDRARVFRAREGIAGDMGTAVVVQAMVFGNLDERSGTGVAFTRDPATGDATPFGDYLPRAQGEDVVAGTHAVGGLDVLARVLPEPHRELLSVLDRLERHERDMCDVEFTVSQGKLYILQTRVGRRSPLADVRIAVAMAEEPDFPLTRAEAVARVDARTMETLAAAGRIDPEAQPLATGLAASPGIGTGALCLDPDRAAELSAGGTAVVLARRETSPSDVHGMSGAAAIVTTLGGVASHAAVVARGWGIPALTSLAGAVVEPGGLRLGATFVAEGDTVTVDGTAGALYLGDARLEGGADIPELRTLRAWAAELAAEATLEHPPARREVSLLEAVRAIHLKGLCSVERAAASLGAAEEEVATLVAANEALFRTTPRGLALTPEGRAWMAQQLAAEREAIDRAVMEGCYERFRPLNARFKQIVSGWQLSRGGDTEPDLPALLASMDALHGDFTPLAADIARCAARLATYAPRFELALNALRTGDATMLASPVKDSYHTVWFEYHEELIEICGLDRSMEET